MIPVFFLVAFATVTISAKPLIYPKESTCGYEACPVADPDALNVHLIPHSHDDLGWLKTVDKYYYQDVQNVISSVIGALKQNPQRRFIQVETAYFARWWEQQSNSTRQDVIDLVNSGRFEITNAGWSMNDEAAVNYQSTIDQYTLGLRYIEDVLGKCGRPTVAWQIDTFGHSREQASIIAQMGMDGLFFMRMDYRDQAKRLSEKRSDLIWRGSSNLGNSSDLFTSIFYGGSYGFPSGFCFDIVCGDEPIVDDEESPDYNYQQRVEEFADFIRDKAQMYPTNNLLIVMGDDVRYQAAHTNFLNIDRLTHGFDLFPQTFNGKPIKVFYSTPSCYTKAVNEYVIANNYNLDLKTDDFLPYATDGYGYWVGFYTSRPTSKRFERLGNNILQISKQLAAIGKESYYNADITSLKDIMGVMQHHDAITGTEKQDVVKDYHRLLTSGINNANEAINPILSSLIADDGTNLELKSCILTNVSSCAQTKSDKFNVAVYNPLSRSVTTIVNLPVDVEDWSILDPNDEEVEYQVSGTIIDFSYVDDVPISSYSLDFAAKDLPPMGFKIYRFTKSSRKMQLPPPQPQKNKVSIGYLDTGFDLDDSTGLLKSITMNGVTLDVHQDLLYYESGSYSGAYIFVPLDHERRRVASSSTVKTTPISGYTYQGIVQEFNTWAKQINKVYNDDRRFIEIDWIIGPIDISDQIGKEVISVFTTPLATQSNFYTDSNGREMLKRTRNYRPTFEYTNEEPEAGNYYPVTSRVVLKDEQQGLELAILNDRSQGATSLQDGQVEIMIQRNCPHHDFRATGRSLRDNLDDKEYNQGIIVRGKHYLILGPSSGDGIKSLAAIQGDIAQKVLLAPWPFFTNKDINGKNLAFTNLKTPLPDNVQILTLEPWSDNTLLIRLEHLLEKDEDENLSKPVTIDLTDLFVKFTIAELQEMTLSGIVPLEESHRLQWPGSSANSLNAVPRDLKELTVTLAPMQIRTFLAKVTYNS